MQSLIDKFSKGKIELKFNLVKPLVEDKKRKRIKIIILILTFPILFCFFKLFQIMKLDNIFLMFGIIIVFFYLLDLFTKSNLLSLKNTGTMKFLPEKIEIMNNEKEEFIPINYSDILAIRYKGNVQTNIVTGKYPYYKSFHIKFMLKNNDAVIVESEFKLHLTSEDLKQFKTFEPHIIQVLEEINPKFGVLNVHKPINNFPNIPDL